MGPQMNAFTTTKFKTLKPMGHITVKLTQLAVSVAEPAVKMGQWNSERPSQSPSNHRSSFSSLSSSQLVTISSFLFLGFLYIWLVAFLRIIKKKSNH